MFKHPPICRAVDKFRQSGKGTVFQLTPLSLENKGAKHYHCKRHQMMTPILASVTGKPCPLDRVELQDVLNGSQQRRQAVQL